MSQESFVLVKDLNFNDANVQAKVGDVLVFTPPEKLVIYRAGDIIGRIGFHKVSLDGLVLSGIILTEKKAASMKATITPDPADEETGIGPVNPPPPPPKKAEAPVEKTEEPAAGDAQVQTPEAGEQQVVDTTTQDAPKVDEPKAPEVVKTAEKPAAKPAAKAAEPAKKTAKK